MKNAAVFAMLRWQRSRTLRTLGLAAAGGLLLSACGVIEIGTYADGSGGAGVGGSGSAIDAGGGATGAAGLDGAGTGGSGEAGGSAGGGRGGESGAANGGAAGGGAGAGGLKSIDIGDTGAMGSTTVDGGTWAIEGSGPDIQDAADAFRFLYASIEGDGQIVARIQEVSETHPWTKVGVMIRGDLTPGAKNAFLLLHPSQGSAFQYRPESGGATVSTWQEQPEIGSAEHEVRYLRPPKWLKLTREGDRFSAYSSDDGECWWPRWWQTIGFDDSEAYFGVALSAGGYGNLASAVVTDVQVQGTIEPHNARCDRAQVDGDLPVPSEAAWIVAPGRFGGEGWDFTTTNPNGSTIEKCDPNALDIVPYEVAPRKDGKDHPNCPDRDFSPEWTRVGFEPGPDWQLEQRLGIGVAPTRPGDQLTTPVDGSGVWLRKEFTLSSEAQKNELMLWGRWDDGITVYINGVLATWNGTGTYEYKYLGLSDAARTALRVGETNVIAVRLEWDRYDWVLNEVVPGVAPGRFFDLGLATEGRLANLPLDRASEPNPGVAVFVDSLKELLQQHGISGATFALSKSGSIVASAGFGWRDKNLTTAMPRDATLRLAQTDVITDALIVRLVEDGRIQPSTPVFPHLDLEPVPGRSPGANVELITVEQLRTHTSGIGVMRQNQSVLDEMAFAFGISPDQWTAEHAARWLYSLDARHPSEVYGVRYSADGSFILRYLIEKLIAPRTLEDYLKDDLGLSGFAVSHERLFGREPNQGYITRLPTWDRWESFESYLSLSAPAPAFASFFDDFALSYWQETENSYAPGDGGVVIQTLWGTLSLAFVDPFRALSMVMISNNHDTYDELVPLLSRLVYETDPCLFGPEDPRIHTGRFHFVSNVAQPERYINIEAGLAASPSLSGWWSAQWRLELVEGAYYRIQSRWTEQYLHMDQGLLQVSGIDPMSLSAQWQLVYVGGDFQLQNRAENEYLSLENDALVTSLDGTPANALWRFCN